MSAAARRRLATRLLPVACAMLLASGPLHAQGADPGPTSDRAPAADAGRVELPRTDGVRGVSRGDPARPTRLTDRRDERRDDRRDRRDERFNRREERREERPATERSEPRQREDGRRVIPTGEPVLQRRKP